MAQCHYQSHFHYRTLCTSHCHATSTQSTQPSSKCYVPTWKATNITPAHEYKLVITFAYSSNGAQQVAIYDSVSRDNMLQLVSHFTTNTCDVQIMITERDD